MLSIIHKIKHRIWFRIVGYFRNKSIYPWLYSSHWHAALFKPEKKPTGTNYLAAIPNPGAGIGHQIANWIAGYWFAPFFNLKFAHIPFSDKRWENFLAFGENEMDYSNLRQKGYRKVRLPLFDENIEREVQRTKKIIDSYSGSKTVFVFEQDQFFRDHFKVKEILQKKFFSARARAEDKGILEPDNFNIAIHVRRGDIMNGFATQNQKLTMRVQSANYFERVLDQVIAHLKTDKPIKIYLFSQGKEEDFNTFLKYRNLQFCLDMGPMETFLNMTCADLLITSKSSFSYKPALLSRGIKISPQTFWHGYPNENSWILANEDGEFDTAKLNLKS